MSTARLVSVLLEGERVRLRPTAESDAAPAFAALHGREPILRWLLWDGPADEAELARAYGAWARLGEVGPDAHLAIVDRAGGELAGMIGVRFTGHPGLGDLGYWIAERFWGRGFASEAIALVAHLAFRHLAAESLCAWVFVGNEASRRALEKNGFRWVHTRAGGARKRGQDVDEWSLVCLRSDWEARAAPAPLRDEVRLAPAEGPPAPRRGRRAL